MSELLRPDALEYVLGAVLPVLFLAAAIIWLMGRLAKHLTPKRSGDSR